jgi:hypothetical protein
VALSVDTRMNHRSARTFALVHYLKFQRSDFRAPVLFEEGDYALYRDSWRSAVARLLWRALPPAATEIRARSQDAGRCR